MDQVNNKHKKIICHGPSYGVFPEDWKWCIAYLLASGTMKNGIVRENQRGNIHFFSSLKIGCIELLFVKHNESYVCKGTLL